MSYFYVEKMNKRSYHNNDILCWRCNMDKEILFMDRKASDNKYLHRDFHLSADIGIAYVGNNYGDDAVKEYLVQFTRSYFAKLVDAVKLRGLIAIEEYLHRIFRAEEKENYLQTELTEQQIKVKIIKCPAIEYMKSAGRVPSKWYGETTKTVYPILAEMAGIKFDLISYNEDTGAAQYIFYK